MMQSLVQVGGSAMLMLSGRGTHTHIAKEADVFFPPTAAAEMQQREKSQGHGM